MQFNPILYKRRFLTIAEIRCGCGQEKKRYSSRDFPGVDAAMFVQSPVVISGSRKANYHTLISDLTKDLEVLNSDLSKNTRYEIKRAESEDGVTYFCHFKPSSEVIERFCSFYQEFAARKGIWTTIKGKLEAYLKSNALIISQVVSPEKTALTWHAYCHDNDRVVLLHSASRRFSENQEFRQLVGRSNRYHHWQDIAQFKAAGFKIYDWGGIYLGQNNAARTRITEFKKKFGGVLETTFNCELPLSLRGKIYFFLRNIYYRNR